MPEKSVRLCQSIAWSLSLGSCAVGLFAWGHDYAWHILPVNSYVLFPLLGLLAFSLMWSHYVAGMVRELLGLDKGVLSRYFKSTSLAVLVLICAHPSLLIYQRFRDGFGLPPGSYESYVAPGLGWVTLLGTASLCVFLAFEFYRIYGKRSWWHYVADASDFAMVAILYHALRLGTQLRHGWFRFVWLLYAITFGIVLIRKYALRYQRHTTSKNPA